jgi:hypothetical protein
MAKVANARSWRRKRTCALCERRCVRSQFCWERCLYPVTWLHKPTSVRPPRWALIGAATIANLDHFVFKGPHLQGAMPDFSGKLKVDDVEKIKAFIQRTADVIRPKLPSASGGGSRSGPPPRGTGQGALLTGPWLPGNGRSATGARGCEGFAVGRAGMRACPVARSADVAKRRGQPRATGRRFFHIGRQVAGRLDVVRQDDGGRS